METLLIFVIPGLIVGGYAAYLMGWAK